MEAREVTEGAAHALDGRRSVIATLAAAGIAGPLLFTVVAVVHSLLREDHSLVQLDQLLARYNEKVTWATFSDIRLARL